MEENIGLKHNILLVEDDCDVAMITSRLLERHEFAVSTAADATQAFSLLKGSPPELILLDLGMPDICGHEICKNIRQELNLDIPILMLSGNQEDNAIIKALELGADDFVSKNTSFEILLAHIRAALRRSGNKINQKLGNILTWGPLKLDRQSCEITCEGQRLELTPNEMRILEIFMSEPGVVFTRSKLIERLHGAGHHLTERTIDVHINGIRTQLGALRSVLETVRSVGYRLSKHPDK